MTVKKNKFFVRGNDIPIERDLKYTHRGPIVEIQKTMFSSAPKDISMTWQGFLEHMTSPWYIMYRDSIRHTALFALDRFHNETQTY